MSNTTLLLIVVAAMMLAAIPVARMMKGFLPNFVERNAGLDQLENRIYVLHSEVHEVQDRVDRLERRRNQQSAEKNRIESDIRKAEKAIRDLADQPPLFVHEVGNPQAGAMKHVVALEQSSATAVNPIWRHANVAEVWAFSPEEARQLVEVAFPFKLGFQKIFQKSSQTAPKPASGSAPPC